MTNDFHKIVWRSPSNIALIKYWGKHGNQLPENASLSMTLKNAVTTTEMSYTPSNEGMELHYYFEGERNQVFEEKVIAFFEKVKSELPFIDDYLFEIFSTNSFPHSTGIASSASSMSALALCLVSLEERLLNNKLTKNDFYKRASYFARLGSGSASRSIYGEWSTWGAIEDVLSSSDEYASKLTFEIHPHFKLMGDAILIVNSKRKSLSSSLGHKLMKAHPFAKARYEQATDNLHALLCSMEVGDTDTFISIVENEALTLHSLLMTSSPNGLLIKPQTIAIIEAIRKYRKETGFNICFTIDAGPNVHLLYPLTEKDKVHAFIEKQLVQYCENGKWLDDETGGGPEMVV